jgi:ABC-type methionine transport system ATPase subunit
MTKEPIDYDLEYLYKQCKIMRLKLPTDDQEDAYIAQVNNLFNHKINIISARIKAFTEIMLNTRVM